MNTYDNRPKDREIGPGMPPAPADDDQPTGLSFNWVPLAIAAMLCLSGFVDNWTFYLYLAVAVIIHELGHVMVAKRFGCAIDRIQVFFFAFVSYKPRPMTGGSPWRDITWSLGVLPWGGFTAFKTRPKADGEPAGGAAHAASSPFIDDKPAHQRLLISAGGVLFNLGTFVALYVVMPLLPLHWQAVWYTLAALSLILAVLNILPIYPLDGGSIIFSAYEIATGHKPSAQFVNVCGIVGFVVIILLFWVFPKFVNHLIDGVLSSVF